MQVKFAIDTANKVIHGDLNSRVNALLSFGLWFAAGAFVMSTAQFYFASTETTLTSVIVQIVNTLVPCLFSTRFTMPYANGSLMS